MMEVTSGIKQGCPMSGSLWCLVFDPIVRLMDRVLSALGDELGVFADDVGLGCGDCVLSLVRVAPVLDIMRVVARLCLNWKKTMVVNFSRHSEFDIKRKIEQSVSEATAVIVCRAARYLGFVVGPDV